MKRVLAATALMLTGLVLAGCATPAPAENQTLPSSPTTLEDTPKTNERGNLQKGIGEVGAVLFPGTEREAIAFKVTAIERDPHCTGDPMWYLPPDHGQFVSLAFEMTTSEDYLEVMAAGEPLRLFWQDWKIFMPDGSSVETTAKGLTGCFPDGEQLPLDIPAGTTSVGKYVLDVPIDAVSVAWYPSYVNGIGPDDGWEWTLD